MPGHATAISPDNTTALAHPTLKIYVGGTGDLKVDTVGGETVTFKAVPVGVTVEVFATRVYNTGTTATLLVAIW